MNLKALMMKFMVDDHQVEIYADPRVSKLLVFIKIEIGECRPLEVRGESTISGFPS